MESELIDAVELLYKNEQDYQPDANLVISLIDKINNDPSRLAMNLSIAWDKFCDEHTICDKCGLELQPRIHKEAREHQGQECEETITEKYCPGCGLVD